MRPILTLALTLLPLGCSDSYYHQSPFNPTYQVFEQEPNNSAFSAQGVGTIAPGTQLEIFGYVAGQDGFGPDGVDGFALVSSSPMVVEFALIGQPGWFSDLDLCLYDPYTGNYVDCWQSWDSDEYGSFYVPAGGQEFHLVVVAANGAANYSLSLTGYSAGGYYSNSTAALERGFGRLEPLDIRPTPGLETYRASSENQTPSEPEQLTLPGLLLTVDSTGQVQRRPIQIQANGALLLQPLK